ncbi:MAG: DinB family protein [bacterium]
MEVLDSVTSTKAAARPFADVHNIWEIVLHIITWKEVAHKQISGNNWAPTDEEDWPQVGEVSDSAWQLTLATLKKTQSRLVETVTRLNDSQLDETVPAHDYSIYVLLHGVVQHDLYHAGQIALLKKHL